MSTTTSNSFKKEISSYILPILIVLGGLFISMGNMNAVNADDKLPQANETAQTVQLNTETHFVSGKAGYTVTGSAGLVPEEIGNK